MYSLYRAWLMQDAVLSTPPDVILHVGTASRATQQFAAHRAVVAAHSGYLKALLPAVVTTETVAVSVPNISPDVFALLLTFMYTGYMDVTHDNIYAVLLATHLLHMPRALDLCRSFLLHNQNHSNSQQQSTPHTHGSASPAAFPTLVKPIPSRKMLPVLFDMGGIEQSTSSSYWLPQPPPPPPSFRQGPKFLLTTANSPFHTVPQVVNDEASEAVLEGYSSDGISSDNRNETTTPDEDYGKLPKKSSLAIASTSVACHLPSPHTSATGNIAPCLPTLLQERKVFKKDVTRPESAKVSNRENSSKENRRVQEKNEYIPPNNSSCISTAVSSGSKVIIDIACCDGPVRFHRVLNDNYGSTLDKLLPDKIKNFFEINDKILHRENKRLCPEKFQTKMLKTENDSKLLDNEGITATLSKGDDTRNVQSHGNVESDVVLQEPKSRQEYGPKKLFRGTDNEESSLTKGSSHTPGTSNSGIDTVYSCLYCNHTFKSHYCYQKHARRHINPVTIDLKCIADKLDASNKNVPACELSTLEKLHTNSNTAISGKTKDKVRREVRLLDMNVQYYPCKTCGSKFPSYYFVHKHRKMCHANEESDSVLSSDDTPSLPQAAVV